MLKKHLVLDPESGFIAARDGAPDNAFPVALTSPLVFAGIVKVHCAEGTSSADLAGPARTFDIRLGRAALFRDTRSAVQQLQELYAKDGTGYIAVGGSPKLVKWLLKQRGFSVVTVNASGVALDKSATGEFTAYLGRKLDKLGAPARYVVMDFADTGASLIKLKADIQALRPSAEVRAVAIGTSPEFNASKNADNKARIDTVLAGIPDLQKALHEQSLKLYVLGRNKVKNDYATWSTERSKALAGAPESGSGIKATTLHAHYQAQKTALPPLIDLPEVDVKFEDLFDEASDSEYESGSASGSDGDDFF